jgi:hypothetical protein
MQVTIEIPEKEDLEKMPIRNLLGLLNITAELRKNDAQKDKYNKVADEVLRRLFSDNDNFRTSVTL